MTTLLPPPKRLKSAYSQSLKPVLPPTSSVSVPSIVVQFRNAEDGSSLGPAINLAADTGRDALQMLVNKLRGEVSLPICCCTERRIREKGEEGQGEGRVGRG